MKAVIYSETGDSGVLTLVDRPAPEPGPGEVLVRIAVSGVNPTDWKGRRGDGPGQPLDFDEVVPNQDGAGTVAATGEGVDSQRVGQRVWLWEAEWQRANGTAQEFVALPEHQAVPLPDEASFDLGASLGIPALTAHRCLTVGEGGAGSLGPGTLAGRVVLVQGGAGAVGHAAIELAVWSGATVIATVSSSEKGALAAAAGAHHVVNYRTEEAAEQVARVAPGGVDLIVEVAPIVNAALDAAVIAPSGTIAVYATGAEPLSIEVGTAMTANTRYQFVLVYTVSADAKARAVDDVVAAVKAGVLRVGKDAGLPLHRFALERTGEAHDTVEQGAIGKILIDVGAE